MTHNITSQLIWLVWFYGTEISSNPGHNSAPQLCLFSLRKIQQGLFIYLFILQEQCVSFKEKKTKLHL